MIELLPERKKIILESIAFAVFIIVSMAMLIKFLTFFAKFPKMLADIGWLAYIGSGAFIFAELLLVSAIVVFVKQLLWNKARYNLRYVLTDTQLQVHLSGRQIIISRRSIIKCLASQKGLTLIVRADIPAGFFTIGLNDFDYQDKTLFASFREQLREITVTDKKERLVLIEEYGIDEAFRSNRLRSIWKTLPDYIDIAGELPESLKTKRTLLGRYVLFFIFWLLHIIYGWSKREEHSAGWLILYFVVMTIVMLVAFLAFAEIAAARKNKGNQR